MENTVTSILDFTIVNILFITSANASLNLICESKRWQLFKFFKKNFWKKAKIFSKKKYVEEKIWIILPYMCVSSKLITNSKRCQTSIAYIIDIWQTNWKWSTYDNVTVRGWAVGLYTYIIFLVCQWTRLLSTFIFISRYVFGWCFRFTVH